MTKPAALSEDTEFSLVLGGPLFQLYRRAHLSGDALQLVRRRVVVVASVAWLPLLLLSVIDGQALSGTIKVPFLFDVETHIRFLIALPILVVAELAFHVRIRYAVRMFEECRIVVLEDMPRFKAAIDSALRARNSVTAEVVMLILVYTLGLWLWRSQVALGAPTWYAVPEGSQLNLTLAGYWFRLVSIPIFQFIILRWYFRFFLWFQFLWRVSRLNLHLIATHPDRTAGLGFLGQSTYSFALILFAQGALLAGLIANRIFFEGQHLMAFKLDAAAFLAFFVALILSPLLVFSSQLARAKREGLRDYGRLGSRYVQRFEEKWIQAGTPNEDELLGTGDVQSLADLGSSYAIVQEMSVVPFQLMDAARLVAATALPLLPLTLTIFSLEEVVTRLLKILF